MISGIPKIDNRSAEDFYNQALKLAVQKCNKWINDINNVKEPDQGMTLLHLFSRLAEIIVNQINRIPEKHLLSFYDFIGMDLLPSREALVPLSFILSDGSKQTYIAARTKVCSSEDKGLIFETVRDLEAVDFKMKAAYSLNPWTDSFTDHTSFIDGKNAGFHVFGSNLQNNSEQFLDHILYVADDLLDFSIPVTIDFEIQLVNSSECNVANWFSRCIDGSGKQLIHGNSLHFENVIIPVSTIDGVEARWMGLMPEKSLPEIKDKFPVINLINISVTAQAAPEIALVNDAVMDLKKGFYLFGRNPAVGDAFYFASANAFSKTGSIITLNFSLNAGATSNVELIWEYWNGSTWTIFLNNSQEKFTNSKAVVVFTCPEIYPCEINGLKSRWIRVRINKGGYGELINYQEIPFVLDTFNGFTGLDSIGKNNLITYLNNQGIKQGMKLNASTLSPPYVNSISIKCIRTKEVQLYKAYNNFEYKNIYHDMQDKTPFELSLNDPAFYLGFEEYPINSAVNLYFSKAIPPSDDPYPVIKKNRQMQVDPTELVTGQVWEYFSSDGFWKKFGPKDETEYFTKNGIIEFIIPSDITKCKFFTKELFWIRAQVIQGSWFRPPFLKGIYPNTVWAESASVIKDELLGTSNGMPSQVFKFKNYPVLKDVEIEIMEPGTPSKNHSQSDNNNVSIQICEVKNKTGDIVETWVTWEEVSSFAFSSSVSRHYVIDRQEGEILFGDGVNGMIPPVLPNNIRAKKYKCGGGKKGNIKTGILTGLKTAIPNIKSAVNHDYSSGGAEQESIGSLIARAPHAIRNRGRAITIDDFEWIAKESSSLVSKTKCYKDDVFIKVIIAPSYEDGTLIPETSLLDSVSSYLKERALVSIQNYIVVEAPEYKTIDLAVEIVPVSISQSTLVSDRIEKLINNYLHPIIGGDDENGWKFGESIYFSTIAGLIEGVEGVDYIESLKINEKTNATFIEIGRNQLPEPGDISINIKTSTTYAD